MEQPINGQMEKADDRRALVREITDAPLELTWTDSDGVRHSVVGAARDTSSDGLSGVFPTRLPTG